jgi:hypothetical protein
VNRFLPPWFLQATGVGLLVGSVVFWAISGRQSELFVGAAMTLILLGAYGAVRETFVRIAEQLPEHEEEPPEEIEPRGVS